MALDIILYTDLFFNEEDLMGQIEYYLKSSENQELHGHFNLTKYVSIDYKPLSDITAYELSQILQIVMGYANGAYLTRTDYDALPDGVRRHIPLLNSNSNSKGI